MYPMETLAPMNRARKPCSSQWGALRRFVTRISTSKLTNHAHAPQSAAAARTLCLRATLLTPLSQSTLRSRTGADRTWYQRLLLLRFRMSNLTLIRLCKSCGFHRFLFKKGKPAQQDVGPAPAREKQISEKRVAYAPITKNQPGKSAGVPGPKCGFRTSSSSFGGRRERTKSRLWSGVLRPQQKNDKLFTHKRPTELIRRSADSPPLQSVL